MTATGGATRPTSADSLGLCERRRLERDLHDGAQQRLVSLALTLHMAREKLDAEPGETGRLLDRSREELDQALRELRDLARGIHPAALADRGLDAGVGELAARAPLPVEVVSNLLDRRLPEQVELAAYFVVSEALANIAKYARASAAEVCVERRDGALHVAIEDDGVGGADADRGSGLSGLSDRVAALDGSLQVDSEPGEGTRVLARLPLRPPEIPG